MSSKGNLIRAAAVGTLWNYSAFAVSKLLIFISTIILARLLAPEDFGLVALGLIVINYMDRFSGMGVDMALIRHQAGDAQSLDRVTGTALMVGVSVDALLATGAFFAAPLAAWFFDEPRVTSIMQVLAVGFFIGSLKNVPEARMKKRMAFQRRFVPELVRSIAKGAIAITLAVMGHGVWSLVWAQFATNVVATIMYWSMSDWRPRIVIDPRIARGLIAFGLPIALLQLMGVFSNSIDYLIVGHRMDTGQLGFYTLAFRLPELVIINICYVLSHVLFPAYSSVQDRPDTLRRGYLMTMRYTSLITVPMGVGIFLTAPQFVRLCYGPKWEPTIIVMQLLALYAVIYTINSNDSDIYKATGRIRTLYAIWTMGVLLAAPVLWWAAGYSLWHVAVGELAVIGVITAVKLTLVSRLLSIRPIDMLQALRPALTGAAVMLAIGYALKTQLTNVPDAATLAITISVGAAVYAGTLWVTDRGIYAQSLALLRPKNAGADGAG